MTQLELPRYQASRSKDFDGFLIVWCPREDCPSFEQRPFVVHRATWMRPMKRVARSTGRTYKITGRSCPYCFRPAHVPKPGEIR